MSGRETVVVTGFGPFRQFLVNPSWTAAQGLKSMGLGEDIEVQIKELPVSYVKTKQIIAEIWDTLKPKCVVHVGVCRGSSVVLLEQRATNRGYTERDVSGSCPEGRCCEAQGPETLCSVSDMTIVSKLCRAAGLGDVLCSRDAGRYLCDFAYYCSLYHGERRAALIHIPTCGGLTEAGALLPLLQRLVQTIISQLVTSSGSW